MSTTDLYDIPECFREKLLVNAQSEEHNELQGEMEKENSKRNSEYLESGAAAETMAGADPVSDEGAMDDAQADGNAETIAAEAENIESVSEEAVETMAHSCRGGNCMKPPCHGENCMKQPCRGGDCMRPPMRPPCPDGRCGRPPYPHYPYHPCPMGGMCRNSDRPPHPVPYFRAYPGMLRMQENVRDEIDMDKMKERYPKTARRIQEYVEEAADRMDYDGSMMFDEYPDQVSIERIVNEIYNDVFGGRADNKDEEVNREKCDCNEKTEIIKELIMVILFQQMYLKRCRNRKCKEWW